MAGNDAAACRARPARGFSPNRPQRPASSTMQTKSLLPLASATAIGQRGFSSSPTPGQPKKLSFAALGGRADLKAQRPDAPKTGVELDEPGPMLAVARLLTDSARAKKLQDLLNANSPEELHKLITEAFGSDLNPKLVNNVLKRLKTAFSTGDWSFLKVVVVDNDHPTVSGGAFAAYKGGDDRVRDRIYIASRTLGDKDQLQASFFEELGHWFDDQVRPRGGDAIGDEGERFSALLSGMPPSPETLSQDDRRLVKGSNGKTYTAENSASNYPTDAQWMAAQYQLKSAWDNLPTKDGMLNYKEFLDHIFKNGKQPSYMHFDSRLDFLSTPVFNFLKDSNNWKTYTGDQPLTLNMLLSKIKNSGPSEAERLRAWHEIEENWAIASGKDQRLDKGELIGLLKPESAFYKKKTSAELAAIDRSIVFFYQSIPSFILSKTDVASKKKSFQPSGIEVMNALLLLKKHWSQAVGSSVGLTPAELRSAASPTSDFGKKLTDSQAKSFALVAEYWLQLPRELFFGSGPNFALTPDELDKKINPPSAPPVSAEYPTEAEWMALQYQLKRIWQKLPIKEGRLDHAEFVRQIFANGTDPSHPDFDPNLNFLSTSALKYLKYPNVWKNYTADGFLTLEKLNAKVSDRGPAEAVRLKAWYALSNNWDAAAKDSSLSRQEIIDAIKPKSKFYAGVSAEEKADIQSALVHFYQFFGDASATLSKASVRDKITALQPSGKEVKLALELLRTYWPQAVGTSKGLSSAELRSASKLTSSFSKKLTAAERKTFTVVTEYWLQFSEAFFGKDRVLTMDELKKKL
jgi:hypothetical protein